MRKCDPITDKILDLIEKRMLVSSPNDRIQCKDLCDKLASFLDDARRACDRPEMCITQEIMATLLDFDRNASSSAAEPRDIKAEQGLGGIVDDDFDHEELRRTLALPDETLRVKSKRFSNPDRQVIFQGKFAHRTPALESALRQSGNRNSPRNSDRGKTRESISMDHNSRPDVHPPVTPSPTPSSLYDPQQLDSADDTFIRPSVDLDRLPSSTSASRQARQSHHEAQWSGREPKADVPLRHTTPPPVFLTEEPGDMTPRILRETGYHMSPAPISFNNGPLNIQQPSGGADPSATPRVTTTNLASALGGLSPKPPDQVTFPRACPQWSPYRQLQYCDEAICKERMRLDMAKKDASIFRRPKKDASLKDLVSGRDFVCITTNLRTWPYILTVLPHRYLSSTERRQ